MVTIAITSILVGVYLVHGAGNSNVISSSTSVTSPTFTVYWVNPPQSSAIQGDVLYASLAVVNAYGRALDGYRLAINLTGTGIPSRCAGLLSASCVSMSITTVLIPTWLDMTPSALASSTTGGGNPQVILVSPTLSVPTGTTNVQVKVEYHTPGTYNWLLAMCSGCA